MKRRPRAAAVPPGRDPSRERDRCGHAPLPRAGGAHGANFSRRHKTTARSGVCRQPWSRGSRRLTPAGRGLPGPEREDRLFPFLGVLATTLIVVERSRVADVTLGRRSRTNRAQGAASPGAAALRAPARAPAPSRGCARLPGASGRGRLPARAAAPGQRQSSAGREVSAAHGAGAPRSGAAQGKLWGTVVLSLAQGLLGTEFGLRPRAPLRPPMRAVPLLCRARARRRRAAQRLGTGRPRSRASLNFTGGLEPVPGPGRPAGGSAGGLPCRRPFGAALRPALPSSRPGPRPALPGRSDCQLGAARARPGAERSGRWGRAAGKAAPHGRTGPPRSPALPPRVRGRWSARRSASGAAGVGRAGTGGARNLRRRLLCALCSSWKGWAAAAPAERLKFIPLCMLQSPPFFLPSKQRAFRHLGQIGIPKSLRLF